MRLRLFSNIGHVMTKIDWEEPMKIKKKHVHCLLGLRHMTTYERVNPATAGPVADTYLELKMRFLFYFALESEKNDHNVGTAVVPEKRFYFPLFILSFFYYFISQCPIHPTVH